MKYAIDTIFQFYFYFCMKFYKMEKELSYSEAFNELQAIAVNMENGTFEIDELSVKIKRATELVNFCKEKLRTIEDDINETLNNNNC